MPSPIPVVEARESLVTPIHSPAGARVTCTASTTVSKGSGVCVSTAS